MVAQLSQGLRARTELLHSTEPLQEFLCLKFETVKHGENHELYYFC